MTETGGTRGVESWLRENSKQPRQALQLWSLMLAHADTETGEIALTHQEMATAVGISRNTVSRIVTELGKIDAIKRERKGRRIRYVIHPSRLGELAVETESANAASSHEDTASVAAGAVPEDGIEATDEPSRGPNGGLAPFAAWAAEQMATFQALAREAGELRRSTMPALRRRVWDLRHGRRLWLAAAAFGLAVAMAAGAWAWWTGHTKQAEIDGLRRSVEEAKTVALAITSRLEERDTEIQNLTAALEELKRRLKDAVAAQVVSEGKLADSEAKLAASEAVRTAAAREAASHRRAVAKLEAAVTDSGSREAAVLASRDQARKAVENLTAALAEAKAARKAASEENARAASTARDKLVERETEIERLKAELQAAKEDLRRAQEYARRFRLTTDRTLRWRRLAEEYLTESEKRQIEAVIKDR